MLVYKRLYDSNAVNYNPLAIYDDSSCCFMNYVQVGQDIDGIHTHDFSGTSVSISDNGNIIAIGANSTDNTGTNSGSVSVYELNSGVWIQLGSIINGENSYDYFGESVSLSSDGMILAVGAWGSNENGSNSGHVRVFEFLSGNWVQIGQDIGGEAALDQSGSAISINSTGNRVAIGAMLNDGNGNFSGHVRVYENISGYWTQLGQDIDGENIFDASGSSVSLNDFGNIVAIGAKQNDGNGNSSGHVRVYELISGYWVQKGQDIDGEAPYDYSGSSVSLNSDGSIVAIGAKQNDGNGNNSGHARIYEFSSGSWNQIGTDIDGEDAGNNFGSSISINGIGNRIIVGAPYASINGLSKGSVTSFNYLGIDWQKSSIIYGESNNDLFGFAIDISNDGKNIIVGAKNNSGNAMFSGHARVFNDNSDCLGCTDSLSINYTPTATADDGSCITCIYGCIDPSACNYDPNATCDDGSVVEFMDVQI